MRVSPISLPRLPHVIESRVETDETKPPPNPYNTLREDVKTPSNYCIRPLNTKKRERKDYLRPFRVPQQTSPTPDTPLSGRSPAVERRNGLSRMDKGHFPLSKSYLEKTKYLASQTIHKHIYDFKIQRSSIYSTTIRANARTPAMHRRPDSGSNWIPVPSLYIIQHTQ